MCEMCKRRDALIEKVPAELKAFIKRGPQYRAPSPERLRAIVDAGQGEHQDRLWRLAMKQSEDAVDAELEFMLEKHSVELKAIEGEAHALVSELLKGKLQINHEPSKPEVVN